MSADGTEREPAVSIAGVPEAGGQPFATPALHIPSPVLTTPATRLPFIQLPDIELLALGKYLSTSGVAVGVATGLTHPIDVIKVKMQVTAIGEKGSSASLGRAVSALWQEGSSSPAIFYRGLGPSLVRALVYGGLRLGMYEPWKMALMPSKEQQTLPRKIAAGALSGCIATAITNPLDVLKIRSQAAVADGGSVPRMLVEVVRREGVGALWKGVGPSMIRASVLTAAQCSSYDESKQLLKRHFEFKEGLRLHLGASMLAGILATALSAPFDTVKVRLMTQKGSSSQGLYRSTLHCFYTVLATEGVAGLYKGWSANYARLGPQTAITFIVYEKMRQLVGMQGL